MDLFNGYMAQVETFLYQLVSTASYSSDAWVTTWCFIFLPKMNLYDSKVYTPLQRVLSPLVKAVPRTLNLKNERKLTVFTANYVTFARTFLIIPIAWMLK